MVSRRRLRRLLAARPRAARWSQERRLPFLLCARSMFPDDDLLKLDTCAINKVLAVARALDLLIAQPAVRPACAAAAPLAAWLLAGQLASEPL